MAPHLHICKETKQYGERLCISSMMACSIFVMCYKAVACAGSKPVHIGYFDSQQGAARAYDQEAIRLRGPNTSLNFPITDYDVSMTHDLPTFECAVTMTQILA